MICRFTVENFKAFAEKVDLVFYADGNIKRLDYNYEMVGREKILKTAGFYGPNNTGKTCLFLALSSLRSLMLNEYPGRLINSFSNKGNVTSFVVEYFINGRFYTYSVDYNSITREYEREKLVLKSDGESENTNDVIFERSKRRIVWKGMDENLIGTIVQTLFSNSFPFMLALKDEKNKEIRRARTDYIAFANSIVLLRMDRPVDILKTMDLLRTDPKAGRFIKEFVKNCDLNIDDFGFDDNVVCSVPIDEELRLATASPDFNKESLKFYSKHNGYRVPTIFFDSIGTMKLIALSGYIYEALRDGKVLIVDEIDSSLHHILTKSIVAMFNNVLNTKAQLLFTTHDVMLLDLKEMFRKDQVWLVDLLKQGSSKAERMSDKFTARSEDGIRGDEDITRHYLKGRFGAIPTPDLFSSLEAAVSDEQ